jgi:hypothetical protein
VSTSDEAWLPVLRSVVEVESTNPGAGEAQIAGVVESWLATCSPTTC